MSKIKVSSEFANNNEAERKKKFNDLALKMIVSTLNNRNNKTECSSGKKRTISDIKSFS